MAAKGRIDLRLGTQVLLVQLVSGFCALCSPATHSEPKRTTDEARCGPLKRSRD
jgi:hypothetical protein